ncbi:hypothetical protein U1Q18_030154, partial [Sarracenia purpurea var. burkii]
EAIEVAGAWLLIGGDNNDPRSGEREACLPAVSDEEEAAAFGYFLWKLQAIFLERFAEKSDDARQSSSARQSSNVGEDSGAVFGARKKTVMCAQYLGVRVPLYQRSVFSGLGIVSR